MAHLCTKRQNALCNINVKEVQVETSLHDSSHNSYRIYRAIREVSGTVCHVPEKRTTVNVHLPVYPVRDVKCPVDTQGREIVGCDRLSLSRALHHEQLGEDGNGFQIYRERPHDFSEVEVVVEYQSKSKTRSGEIFDLERIKGWVVSRTWKAACQPKSGERGGSKH